MLPCLKCGYWFGWNSPLRFHQFYDWFVPFHCHDCSPGDPTTTNGTLTPEYYGA